MRFFRARHVPKHRPSLRWRFFGILVLLASLALAAWVKVEWTYWLIDQVSPNKKIYTAWELQKQADELNRAIDSH